MAKKMLVSDAAHFLNLSTKTLHKMDADGRLKAERTSEGYRLYDEDDLKKLAKERKKAR